MSGPPLISVDFSGRRRPQTVVGAALLIVGVLASIGAFFEYRHLEAARAGVESRLADANHRNRRNPAQEKRNAGLSAEAGGVVRELGTPWTHLLAELEGASHDSASDIALLSVEPDEAKHLVHVTGESRDLPRVLAYVSRLQTSLLLRYPMLDSHEVRSEDPQRPVRFALSAEWRQP
ncbi:MAG: hypothetical protein JO184_08810 [Gammaproteobacteria bacterium]|nr:hypothetical protein [Gammaproteobacteria bacterium]MBV8308473.1 hypothetical protein [Gammaproteobacteria bacterium]